VLKHAKTDRDKQIRLFFQYDSYQTQQPYDHTFFIRLLSSGRDPEEIDKERNVKIHKYVLVVFNEF